MELYDKATRTPTCRELVHEILNLIRECENKGIRNYEDYIDKGELYSMRRLLKQRISMEDNEELKRELGID